MLGDPEIECPCKLSEALAELVLRGIPSCLAGQMGSTLPAQQALEQMMRNSNIKPKRPPRPYLDVVRGPKLFNWLRPRPPSPPVSPEPHFLVGPGSET